ncbi:MAG TPA: ABC transporter permease [Nitrolancea sp.]|nr:ABC transporter permease [Nitrolancea sp.]
MTYDARIRVAKLSPIGASEDFEKAPAERDLTIIEPSSGWRAVNLRELWRFRELLYFLTWRDVKVRYKQTAIGAFWAVLQPFLTMVIFTILFGRLAKISSDNIPYPVFSYSGLLPWTFFANAIGLAGLSLVTNANMIAKIYFPRLLMPAAAVLGATLDFCLAFVILIAMMFYYGITPGIATLALPLFLALAIFTALGISLWLSALNVKYRDIRYVIPFLTQVWMFLTPVLYPSSMIPEKWRLIYGLNPMSGVVEGFRWSLLGTEKAPGAMILVSAAVVVLLFVGGLFYFRRMEREFADVI